MDPCLNKTPNETGITCNMQSDSRVGECSRILSWHFHSCGPTPGFFYSCFSPTYSPLFRFLIYRSVRHTENHALLYRWVTNTPSVKIMFSLYFPTNINASMLVFKGYVKFFLSPVPNCKGGL
jgi:hypothetical protein